MRLQVEFGGMTMHFQTAPGLFSPMHADRGTLAMLETAPLRPGLRVLDLGCGWGLAGVYAALVCGAENVVMTDVDPRAAEAARLNARLNGVPDPAFDLILLNPPYQSDFSVAKKLILKSFNRLEMGGRLFLVVKRRDWYFNKLKSVFGGARVRLADGYFVFEAERRSRSYAQT